MSALILGLLLIAGEPQVMPMAAAAASATAASGTAASGTAASPGAGPAAPYDELDKMVCRRHAETGSLIRSKRECHTKRQWAYLDEQNQIAARTMVDDGRSKGSNGN